MKGTILTCMLVCKRKFHQDPIYPQRPLNFARRIAQDEIPRAPKKVNGSLLMAMVIHMHEEKIAHLGIKRFPSI